MATKVRHKSNNHVYILIGVGYGRLQGHAPKSVSREPGADGRRCTNGNGCRLR